MSPVVTTGPQNRLRDIGRKIVPARPRITYVVSRWGAPTETFVRREAAALVALGADVNVLSIKQPLPTALDVEVTHLSVLRVTLYTLLTLVRHPVRSLRIVEIVARLASVRNLPARLGACAIGLAWARERPLGTLHAHFGWVSATAAWAMACVRDQPYNVVLHAFDLHSERHVDQFTPVPLSSASAVYAISRRDASKMRERWNIRAEVLRMGVPADWLTEPSRVAERDPRLVVAIGSLVAKKGHHVLLEALARTREDWRLVIVGEGPEREFLHREAMTLGVAHRVVLRGAQDEGAVRDLVDQAAVVVLACIVAKGGDRDGIPVALMESMARATPVVSTTVGGIEELVGGVGILVPPNDPRALAAAIDSLADSKHRDRLGRAGRARIEAEYQADHGARLLLTRVGTSWRCGQDAVLA